VIGEAILRSNIFEMFAAGSTRARAESLPSDRLGICHFWRRRFDKASPFSETSFDETAELYP